MATATEIRATNQTKLALAVLIGLAAIGGLVWLGFWWQDRGVRAEVVAVVDRISAIPGFNIEGDSDRSNVPKPSPEEVDAIVGRKPDVPIDPNAEKTTALYSWQTQFKKYEIYIKFKKNKKTKKLEMSGGKVFGNPFSK